MAENGGRRSEFAEAMRRGMGWALGAGLVVGAASALKRGVDPTLKAAVKTLLRAREAGAEVAERVQDVYAEAQSEYAAERLADADDDER